MYPFQGVQFEGQKLHEADFITVVVVDTVRPKARRGYTQAVGYS